MTRIRIATARPVKPLAHPTLQVPIRGIPERTRRAARGLSFAVACLMTAVLPSCGLWGEDPEPQPNIVLISVESLRADHVACYGHDKPTSPFMDELAAGGARFERLVGNSGGTRAAHALLLGTQDASRAIADSLPSATLADQLSELGYDTAGFFAAPSLHPVFGFAQGFDVYRSCMTTTSSAASDEEVRAASEAPHSPALQDITGPKSRERIAEWAADRKASNVEDPAPFFLFVHLWDVHEDFVPPEEFRSQFVDPFYAGEVDGRMQENPAIRPGMDTLGLEQLVALYDAEILFTDTILRDIFADLKLNGLMDNTVVMLVGGTGPDFASLGGRGDARRIPLIVRWPGKVLAGSSIEQAVELADLPATIAALAGTEDANWSNANDLSPLLIPDGE